MKNSGFPAEEVEHEPYPVPEEDSFTPPQDDFAEIKYMAKEKLSVVLSILFAFNYINYIFDVL